MEDDIRISDQGDSIADVIAAVALVVIFVAACVFWVSAQ